MTTPTSLFSHTALARAVAGLALPLALVACGGGGGSDAPPAGSQAFDPNDRDGDGVPNSVELAGWQIAVDASGLGADGQEIRVVSSDPDDPDTDGDGLGDGVEFQIRSDPSSADTDSDGLDDRDERVRYQTSPSSADTDGDARGPDGSGVPRAQLFDGNELLELGTSPTLADTDGDGRSDYVEFTRGETDPLIADLPRLDVELVGDLDVRLDVEYAESIGETTEYGTTFSTSRSRTSSSSTSTMLGTQTSFSLDVTAEATLIPPGASVSTSFSLEGGVSTESTWTSESEESSSSQVEHSRLEADSRDRTEVAASGRISVGLQLHNAGDSTYTIDNLAITALYAPDSDSNTQRAIATLIPEVDSLTLAPGERSGVLNVVATDVNADLVKRFLARPDTLVLQPAFYDLQDANGIDFEFLTESTFARTATVEIHYGGDTYEIHRVAATTRRDADGNALGLSLIDALDTIGVDFTVVEQRRANGKPNGKTVFRSIRNRSFTPGRNGGAPSSWGMILDDGRTEPPPRVEDVLLRAGDHVALVFSRDADGDGLLEFEESAKGTLDTSRDTDGDGISDRAEIRDGWIVDIPNYPELGYAQTRVESDPRTPDTDGDGLDDRDERRARTDPMHPDTDRDGLTDSLDPHPRIPARPLFVVENGSGMFGRSWTDALGNVAQAVRRAESLNGDARAENDVNQIWLSRGTYEVPAAGLVIGSTLQILGGFDGIETKVGQREPNPLFNGVTLTGDIDGLPDPNGPLTPTIAALQGNADPVVRFVPGSDPDTRARALLDGVTIDGGNGRVAAAGGAVVEDGAAPTIRNVLFRRNVSDSDGGALSIAAPAAGTRELDDRPRVERCTFSDNWANTNNLATATIFEHRGSGAAATGAVFVDCEFIGNHDNRAGSFADCDLTGCEFTVNDATLDVYGINRGGGGALAFDSRFIDCVFFGNRRVRSAFRPELDFGAGLRCDVDGFTAINCVFDGNEAQAGGAIFNGSPGSLVVNCTIVANRAAIPAYWDYDEDSGRYLSRLGINPYNAAGGILAEVPVRIANTILADNVRLVEFENESGVQELMPYRDETAQYSQGPGLAISTPTEQYELPRGDIGFFKLTLRGSLQNTFVSGLYVFGSDQRMVSGDPEFTAGGAGNFTLQSDSVCIDAGNNFVDTNLSRPGLQPLPMKDANGDARFVDGRGRGSATVDIGAFEFQGS